MAVSAGGGHIAVSGRRGLALYNRAQSKWRVFGNVQQVCWLGTVTFALDQNDWIRMTGSEDNITMQLSPYAEAFAMRNTQVEMVSHHFVPN